MTKLTLLLSIIIFTACSQSPLRSIASVKSDGDFRSISSVEDTEPFEAEFNYKDEEEE